MRNLFAFVACFFLTLIIHAQKVNTEGCPDLTNKEADKLLKKALKSNVAGEARMLLRKTIELDPNHYIAAWELGRRTWVNDMKDEALEHFKVVSEQCPGYHPDVFYFLGKSYEEKRDYAQAIQAWETFLKRDDISDSHYEEVKSILPELKKKESLFKKVVDFNPTYVSGVCTPGDEYSASLSPDNTFLFFTRKENRSPSEFGGSVARAPVGVEIFYRSKAMGNNTWAKGEEMVSPFNQGHTNGAAALTADNKTMYFVVCPNNEYQACDLWFSRWEGFAWAPLQRVSQNINSAQWDSQPTISYDGNSLIFSSNRPGGLGGTDLYMSERNPQTNEWGPPKNLGAVLNTDKNELTPFLHSDSQTLYFSSKGHDNIGGYDVFYTRRKPDGTWEKPINIGNPINTQADEVSFFVSLDGKKGYFSSNNLKSKEGKSIGPGGLDVYSFDLYEEARPAEVFVVRGVLKDNDGQRLGGSIEVFNETTQQKTTIEADRRDGEFVAILKANEEHTISVETPGLAFSAKSITKENAQDTVALATGKISEGAAFNLSELYFETNSIALSPKAKTYLKAFARWLDKNKSAQIAIHGHTDNVGDSNANLALSADRANAVKQFLIDLGVQAHRIQAKGFGSTKPIASNATTEGKSKNRRTEFVILKP